MLGEAIIKGMAVTAKNFLGSYVSEERLTTIQYPDERQPLQEAVRPSNIIYCSQKSEIQNRSRTVPEWYVAG